MRRGVAVLLTLCLTASSVEALVGAGQHAEIHTGAASPPVTAPERAPLAGTPGGEPSATPHDADHTVGVVLPRHAHHGTGDPAPPIGGHCAHFHTVGPVGAVPDPLPLSLVESRGPGERPAHPAHPVLAPPTQPPRA